MLNALRTREEMRQQDAVRKEARRIQREQMAAAKEAANAQERVEVENSRRLRAGRRDRATTLRDNRSTRRAIARLRAQRTFSAPSKK